MGYSLAANGTVQGNLVMGTTLCRPSGPCVEPAKLERERWGAAGGFALAGTLLLSLGLRRKATRWLMLALIAFVTLAGMTGVSGCGSEATFTPGTYTFTITASGFLTGTNVELSETTTANVTVPPGIPVSYY